MKYYLNSLLFIFLEAAFCCLPAAAARYDSSGFYDSGGSLSQGSMYLVSNRFESNSKISDMAVSTAQSPSYSGRSGPMAFYPQPSPIGDLSVMMLSTYSLRLSWNAPYADGYRKSGSVAGYVVKYSSQAIITGYSDFYNATAITQAWVPHLGTSTESYVLEGFTPGVTYYFAIESINTHLLYSEISNPGSAIGSVPLAPMRFKIVTNGTSVSLTWIPPSGYSNRIAYDNIRAPAYPYEVSGYQIFRATAPCGAEWTMLAGASSDTFAWTDYIAAGQMFYYQVRAVNLVGASAPTFIRANAGDGSLYYAAPDQKSYLEVPAESADLFIPSSSDPMDSYVMEFSSVSADLGGRVLKSLELSAYRGGLQKAEGFRLSKPGLLKMAYQRSGDTVVPSAGDWRNMGVYYYNGAKWLQLYGSVDDAAQTVALRTALLGKYQIRSVERVGGFAADVSGVSNRLITPNGDGKNDTMVMVFDNPLNSRVTGRIYDMKGALVADMSEGPVGNSLIWDARSHGKIVPGGVYIYQLQAEGKIYNGTVTVIK